MLVSLFGCLLSMVAENVIADIQTDTLTHGLRIVNPHCGCVPRVKKYEPSKNSC